MEIKYRKLRAKILEVFGTHSAFAKAVDLSETQLSKKLNGKTAISVKDMYKWGETLGIEVDDFVDYFVKQS